MDKKINDGDFVLVIGKKTIIIIAVVIALIFTAGYVFAWISEHDDPRYQGYEHIINMSDGDIIAHDILIINDLEITRHMRINGSIIGGPNGIKFQGATNRTLFSLYPFHAGEGGNAPEDFDDALILQTDDISNPYNMEFCWWDKENQLMTFCSNEGAPNRATTFRRSLQIIGNVTKKENDLNFTLCEDANYVDCSTDITGADLLVDDDIEAQAIYSNEGFTTSGCMMYRDTDDLGWTKCVALNGELNCSIDDDGVC